MLLYLILASGLILWGMIGPLTWLRLGVAAPHVVGGAILVLLICELLGRPGPAVAAGVIYVIHPLHFEAGPYPATPAAFIDAALYLAILAFLARWMRDATRRFSYAASIGLMIVGAVLASTIVTVPLVAAAWLLIDRPRAFARRLPALVPHAAVMAGVTLLHLDAASAASTGGTAAGDWLTLLWQWLALGPWLVLSFEGSSLIFIVLGTLVAWALYVGPDRRQVFMAAALGIFYCLPALPELAVPGTILTATNASIPVAGFAIALAWALPRARLTPSV
ncbi:MAG: hypothetical protein KC466_19145 [Myxococcales bacterium]|nr:hypothetical protein [Myxococcales bacterium]